MQLLKPTKTVEFDPSNKEHRAAVGAFMERNAWSDSPIRFSHDPEYGSVAEQVKDKLLNWYMIKETLRSKHRVARRSVMKAANEKVEAAYYEFDDRFLGEPTRVVAVTGAEMIDLIRGRP